MSQSTTTKATFWRSSQTTARKLTGNDKFCQVNAERQMLCSINPGVPIDDALQQASNLLSGALDLLADSFEGKGSDAQWSIHHLFEEAKAIVDASIAGGAA